VESLTAADPRMVGDFRLLARLGSGGMGQVFVAASPAGRMVAIKIIHPELARDPKFVSRFRGEVSAARMISGLYTAPVVAAGAEASPLWLATAFVPGPSLEDIVTRRGPLPVPAVWRLAGGLAEALRAIHSAGLVHRDLKPENVLLALDGPRVIDFGISRALTDARMTGVGMVMGTPAYMSPEHVEGRAGGPPGDVFSLGCVLAFAASGTPPFSSPGAATASVFYRVVHAQPDLGRVPAEVRELVAACLAKDPAQRPDLGKVADLGAAATKHLGLSPAAFWPPGVARVIQAQQEAASANIRALQGASPDRRASGPDNEAGTAGVAPSAVRKDSQAVAMEVPRMVAVPIAAGAGGPACDGSGSDDGPASDSPASDAPGSDGPGDDGSGSDDGPASDAPGSDGPGDDGAKAPANVGSRAADGSKDGKNATAMPGARSMSRRRLLIGAGVAGVAAIGGLTGWALATDPSLPAGSHSKGSGAGRTGASGRATSRHRAKTTQPTRDGAPGAKANGAAGTAAGEKAQPTVPDVAGLEPGQQVWSFATGDWVNANPTVADGVVYVGSRDGHLYAVSAATGQQAWRYPASGLFAAPTVTSGNVCVADTGGTFYAISQSTGVLAWQQSTKSAPEFMPSWAASGSSLILPTATGNLQVYIAQNGKTGKTYTSADFTWAVAADGSFIYALDVQGALHIISETGTEVLSSALPDITAGTDVVAVGVNVYLGDTGGKLYSIRTDTGDVNWSFQAEHGLGSDPVYADGYVYFSDTSGVVYALAVGTGNLVWTYSTAVGSGGIGPAVANGQVYICTSDSVQSLDAASGEPGWSFAAPGNASFVCTPAVADGIVYAGCQDYNLYAIVA
jgi:outer membrane protein assembly factor BamB